ncbi:hypothetical protein PIIN_11112 [Serendipita indica DSM 11827]|uniref:Uncharacterized protein n=1 Tax=Serendipita indica (strain DSM 11827) TaxID=1109443 RepID=G4U0N6_SERID|nr:hypothetical protein PIIN_11112 [Serendipita indica DSM 11827]
MSRPRATGKAPSRKHTQLNISPPRAQPSTSEITQRLREQRATTRPGAATSTQARAGHGTTAAERSAESLKWLGMVDQDTSGKSFWELRIMPTLYIRFDVGWHPKS